MYLNIFLLYQAKVDYLAFVKHVFAINTIRTRGEKQDVWSRTTCLFQTYRIHETKCREVPLNLLSGWLPFRICMESDLFVCYGCFLLAEGLHCRVALEMDPNMDLREVSDQFGFREVITVEIIRIEVNLYNILTFLIKFYLFCQNTTRFLSKNNIFVGK